MKKVIHLDDDSVLVLQSSDFEEWLDMDDLTTINYQNLFGDAVTCSALLNKIGQLRADAEANASTMKMKYDIVMAEERRRYRKMASKGKGFVLIDGEKIKLTEKGLEDILTLSSDTQFFLKEYIQAKKEFEYLNSLYFSIQSKDKKLSNFLSKVTPKEFLDEIIEGKINTFEIKRLDK
jgi:hypothetical protein|nr:MAG: Recombination, repair and ssDNA binding protein UvsY [Bacteriophage sp.]